MGIGDIRYTVLQIVNEMFRKLNLSSVTSTGANKLSIQCVDHINDVCNDLADFGEWQEMLVSANITAVSGKRDYSIATSGNLENINDMFFSTRRGPMRNVSIADMRILTRSTIVGTPTQYTIFGTDSNGNPVIRVRPTPASNEDGQLFSILYHVRTPLYLATADDNTIVPFPARVMVLGTLARVYLNESQGAPTEQYNTTNSEYQNAKKEAYNRFVGDTGWFTSFVPSLNRRKRT